MRNRSYWLSFHSQLVSSSVQKLKSRHLLTLVDACWSYMISSFGQSSQVNYQRFKILLSSSVEEIWESVRVYASSTRTLRFTIIKFETTVSRAYILKQTITSMRIMIEEAAAFADHGTDNGKSVEEMEVRRLRVG